MNVILKRRQLILATLVVALGAAGTVFLVSMLGM